MTRYVVIGTTGSGKTTLARRLAAKTGGVLIDLDEYHWLPNWQERAADEREAMVAAATDAPAWAVSGNYSKLRDIVWGKATTVVYLNYSTPRTFWQLLRRSVARAATKAPICNGNIETWRKLFSGDSIIVWFFKSHWKRRREMEALLENPAAWPHIRFLRFKNPRQTEEWIKTL